MSLDAETLVTGVCDRVLLSDAIADMFANAAPREAVYYGWPVLIVTDQKGAQRIAPVVMTELERPASGVQTTVARINEPHVNPGLISEDFFPRYVLAGAEGALSRPLPFGDCVGAGEGVQEMLEGLGLDDPRIDPLALDREVALEVGVHNVAMVFTGASNGATRALSEELLQLRERTDWDRSAAAFLVNPRPSTAVAKAPATDGLARSFVQGLAPLSMRNLRVNDSQEQALGSAAMQRVTVVTGPPGTGKSQLVAGIVANQWLAGASVLVASTNNAAVDVAVTRCASIDPSLLIRTGNRDYRDALHDTLCLLQGRPKGTGLSRRLLRQQVEVAASERDLVLDGLAARSAAEYELAQVIGDLEGIQSLIWGAPTSEPMGAERHRLQALARRRAVSWWFPGRRGRRVLALAKPTANTVTAGDVLAWVALTTRAEHLTEHLTSIGPADPVMDRAALAQAQERWSEAGHQALLATVLANLEAGNGAIDQLTRVLKVSRAVRINTIAAAMPFLRGWGCTALAAQANFPLTASVIDLLVLDEASQCSIAAILPLAYRARRIVVVGDPSQLTPIVTLSDRHLEDIAAACGTTEAAMHQARLSASADSAFSAYSANASRSHLLDEHYRCHPQIAAFINRHFYAGALRVLTDVSTLDEDPRGLSFINIDGRTERAAASGVFNTAEADAIASWVLGHPGLTGTLGIVTPFAAQVAVIRTRLQKVLGAQRWAAARIAIGTAHTFQGGECDVVLFSLVLARDAPLNTARWVEHERNLINVAVSRAKRALVIFGDQGAIAGLPVPTLQALVASARVADAELTGHPATEVDLVEVDDLHCEAERRLNAALLRQGLPVQRRPVIEGYECDFTIQTPDGVVDIEVGRIQPTDERGRQRRQDLARDAILNTIGICVIRVPAWRCLRDPEDALRELGLW